MVNKELTLQLLSIIHGLSKVIITVNPPDYPPWIIERIIHQLGFIQWINDFANYENATGS